MQVQQAMRLRARNVAMDGLSEKAGNAKTICNRLEKPSWPSLQPAELGSPGVGNFDINSGGQSHNPECPAGICPRLKQKCMIPIHVRRISEESSAEFVG